MSMESETTKWSEFPNGGKQLQFPVANTLFSFNEKQICYEYIVAFTFFPFFGMKIDLKLAMQLSLDCM